MSLAAFYRATGLLPTTYGCRVIRCESTIHFCELLLAHDKVLPLGSIEVVFTGVKLQIYA